MLVAMMRRVLDTPWFLPAIGVALGGLAVAGLTLGAVPMWIRWVSAVVVGLATIAPVAPFLALLPWHFVAVRRGLIRRSRVPYSVTVAHGALIVEHRSTRIHCELNKVSRARRARNDNWTESKMLEDAMGLFSANGRELVRVPLSAVGVDALVRELGELGVAIEEVLVSAPTVLD